MPFFLEIEPELEQQLQVAAGQAGLTPDKYIVDTLQQRLQHNQSRIPHLSADEARLFNQINQSLAAIQWQRYHELVTKRDDETLTAPEQAELIALSDQIEVANVQRMTAILELAQLRMTTPTALMHALGLQPITNG